jgi:hypothetical protein
MYNSKQKTMKKIATSLLCSLFVALTFTSCLPEGEETELTSTVALLSFSINDLKTQHTITLENGKDSTYTTIMKASLIPFNIDQERGLVYNTDSIAYGTNLTRVVPKISADGYVYYFKGEEKVGYNKEDTIDFTRPVRFSIVSHDNKFSREYLISVNKYQVDPKVTAWRLIENSTFPAQLYAEQKSVIRDNLVFVLGKGNDGYYYTTSTNDGVEWTAATLWNGITEGVDCSSIVLVDDIFYLLAENALYRSENGVDWSKVNTHTPLSCLIPSMSADGTSVWSISNGLFVTSSDMTTWQDFGQQAGKYIKKVAGSFCQPLRTNKHIYRTLFVTGSSLSTDTCAQVWSKLSTETEWVEVKPVETNIYGCPNLENLAVISYRDKLYAFGGKSLGNRHVPIEAFSTCFESRDNGVTWKVRNRAFSLPEKFAGREDTFSTIVDDHNRVWVIWSTSGEVWQGTWSGIE